MTVVLDAWAVIDFVNDASPVAGLVERLLAKQRPVMSWMNLGEVFYGIRRKRGEHDAMAIVRDIRDVVNVVLPDADDVLAAGRIKSEYRMSFADAFAAATAVAHDATLWTGDPELLIAGAPWKWKDLRS